MRIQITNNGTTVSFRALDEGARDFLHSVGAEDWQFLGANTLVMDWRVARDFVERVEANGEGVEWVEAA